MTQELGSRIVEARLAGSSLNTLRRELQRNRYTRMYAALGAYYRHCEQYEHSLRPSTWWSGSLASMCDRGARPSFDSFPPELHNPAAYFDHNAPTTMYMSEILQRHARHNTLLWTT